MCALVSERIISVVCAVQSFYYFKNEGLVNLDEISSPAFLYCGKPWQGG